MNCEGMENSNSIRYRIEKLHALLAEAMAVGGRIVGIELETLPQVKTDSRDQTDYALNVIESGLEIALGKAEIIVEQLLRIEKRL